MADVWGFDPDFSVSPGEDYYAFINNNWLKNNPMPADYTRYGSFELLHQANLDKVKGILENDQYKDEAPVHVYRAGMDAETLNQQGYLAIQTELNQIKQSRTKDQLFEYGVKNRGQAYLKTLFDIYTEGDKKESSMNIIYMSQSGLGLPDRDYYLDESKKEQLQAYTDYLKEIFKLLNLSPESVQSVIDFETAIAKISLSKVEQRDVEKTYNIKTSIQEIKDMAPNFNWDLYFQGIPSGKISVQSPKFMTELSNLWAETEFQVLQNYFLARTISSASNYMTDEIYDAYFRFAGIKMSGQKEPKPRWKRVISAVEDDLGEPLGRIYSELYFNADAKRNALDMIECIGDFSLKFDIYF